MTYGFSLKAEHVQGLGAPTPLGLEIGLESLSSAPMRDKRGLYRKSYIVAHGRGFKYVRAIPKDLQDIEKKCAWVKCLGAVGRAEAETQAHALAHEHGKRILALRALSEDERRAITAAALDNGDKGAGKIEFASRPVALGIGLEPNADDGEERQAQEVLASIKSKLTEQVAYGGLMSLVDLWEKIKPPRTYKTSDRARLCVRRFIKLVGDVDPNKATREHVIAFRDALEKLPGMSALNIAEHLGKLHALFNVALSEGLVTANPASKVKARKANGKLADGRQAFTSDQVRAVFKALDFESEDFRWVVRLLAYHGMRSGEACQLRCDDVTMLQGVHVLRIHDRHGRVKNRASVRDIPIHPACMGIVAYAREVVAKHGAESWLFVSLPVKKSRRTPRSRTTAAASSCVRRSASPTGAIQCTRLGIRGARWRASGRCRTASPEASWVTRSGGASMMLMGVRRPSN